MLIKEVLSPVNGLFSNMPDSIWGPDFDPSFVDIELFTRIGTLEASPLMEHYVDTHGVLNTSSLSDLLFQRFGNNWQRIWDALLVEYNIMFTSTSDETRTTESENAGTETRDLTDTSGGTVGKTGTDARSSVRDGSVTRSGDSTLTHDVTDLETRALTGSETESGTEKLKDIFAETNTVDSELTYSGSETTVGTDDEDRNLTKANTGTVQEAGSGTQTGNGSTTTDAGKFGIGGAGLANDTRDVVAETRNFADTSSSTRTDNLTEAEGGSVERETSSTLSYTNRKDRTLTEDAHTGSVNHDTTFGKATATTDAGTVSQKRTGTEGNEESSTETYNDLTDTIAGNTTDTETRNLTDTHEGTVQKVDNGTVTETFHSEGSSPLRTFQALIQEEIEGRTGQGWNFTDIIVKDVQSMIASRVWPRRNRYGAL